MTNERPEVSPSGLYTQKQAAGLLGVAPCTLRRWERRGLCRFARRKAGGGKAITGAAILRLWSEVW